jgi:hypothetical protein
MYSTTYIQQKTTNDSIQESGKKMIEHQIDGVRNSYEYLV